MRCFKPRKALGEMFDGGREVESVNDISCVTSCDGDVGRVVCWRHRCVSGVTASLMKVSATAAFCLFFADLFMAFLHQGSNKYAKLCSTTSPQIVTLMLKSSVIVFIQQNV